MTESEHINSQLDDENDMQPCENCGVAVSWCYRNDDGFCQECEAEMEAEKQQENEHFEKN
jgi:hypothetical protein